MTKGIVSDIQRASFHDGTGIRTTVFLKGCPMRCAWCHNPESISPKPQELFYREKCIGCGGCAEGCFSGARVVCGREMTAQEVQEEILLDRPYYREGGGVTFSGGEPLMQVDFLRECISLCRSAGIGCAVETSLFYFDEEIFQMLDFVMADLKIWNDEIHKQYTGVSNERIKKHFLQLDALNIPIIVRTPVIPEIEQGIDRISAFVRRLKNLERYELLPYHALGNAKREAMGEDTVDFSTPSKEYLKELERYADICR